MFSSLTAVLFDFDGTLIDASAVICACFNAALTKYDLEPVPFETIKLGIGRPLRELFAEQGDQVSVDLLTDEYKRVFAELSAGRSYPLPGAEDLVSSLSRGHRLGIVTSRSSSGTSKILKDLGLLDCFSTIVGIEDVINGKPDPEPVFLALERLSVRPHHSVFIGDTTYDMQAGSRAGTRTIGVTSGSHTREELLEAGAEVVVGNLYSLRSLLNGSEESDSEITLV